MASSVHFTMSTSDPQASGIDINCIDPALLDQMPIRAPTPQRASPAPKAAFIEQNAEASSSASSLPTPPRTPSRPPSRTERKFKCQWAGCDKAYFKPARLREHELSHTGEVSVSPGLIWERSLTGSRDLTHARTVIRHIFALHTWRHTCGFTSQTTKGSSSVLDQDAAKRSGLRHT